MDNKWTCHLCRTTIQLRGKNKHLQGKGHQRKEEELINKWRHSTPQIEACEGERSLEENASIHDIEQPAQPIEEDATELTPEMLIHLYCTQKNISLTNEKKLFEVLSLPPFDTLNFSSFATFKKQLKDSLPLIAYETIYTRFKHPDQKNYKPQDVAKLGKLTDIPVYNLQQHLEMFLCDPQLSSSVIVQSSYNGELFSTFDSGKYFHDLCQMLPRGTIPICLELYWDDTGISSKKKCGPVWVGIANCTTEVKRSTQSRMLLSVLPGNSDTSAMISHLVSQVEKLRMHHFYFGCYDSSLECSVTLSMVLGDAPASNTLIGLRSPTCSNPCRVCLVSLKNLKDIPDFDLDENSVDKVEWTLRSVDTHVQLVQSVQQNHKYGEMEKQEKLLKQAGACFYLSPLCKIPSFNIFTQSPYCLLHNEFLGLIPFHIERTVASLSKDSIATLNLRITSFPNLPNLPSLNADIEERKGWEGKAYTAFYKMALFVLRGLLNKDEMLCWRAHCRYIRYLMKPSINKETMESMMASYWQWKKLFIDLYKSHAEVQSTTASKKQMTFLNLHVGEHWADYIKQFGMPTEYSTQHWEVLHQQIKRKEKKTNHRSPANDIAKQIIEQKVLQYRFGSVEDICKEAKHGTTRLLINNCILLSSVKKQLSNQLKLLISDYLMDQRLPLQYKQYHSVIVKGHKLTHGDCFSFLVDEDKKFGQILTIISVGNFIGFVAKLFKYANPKVKVDENQTEFYSLTPTDTFAVISVDNIRKEQVLYCEEIQLYLVNFYY